VLDHVGQGFLDDAVGRLCHARVHRPHRPALPQPDRRATLGHAPHERLDLVQPGRYDQRVVTGYVAQHAEQPAQLRQRPAAARGHPVQRGTGLLRGPGLGDRLRVEDHRGDRVVEDVVQFPGQQRALAFDSELPLALQPPRLRVQLAEPVSLPGAEPADRPEADDHGGQRDHPGEDGAGALAGGDGLRPAEGQQREQQGQAGTLLAPATAR
jgi:hypothetical protein